MISLHQIERIVQGYATVLPLDVFVGVLSFAEELIPVIPATAVMVPAGALALSQGHGLAFLVWLTIVSTVTKTAASWLLYVLGDKAEDVIVKKFGWLFGIKHEDVEGLGKRLNGGWKDDLVLLLLRTAPFVPTPPVSLACGAIRIRPRTYIWTTFVGFLIKNFVYLYVGYAGVKAYARFARFAEHSQIQAGWWIAFFVILVFAASYLWTKRKQR